MTEARRICSEASFHVSLCFMYLGYQIHLLFSLEENSEVSKPWCT